MRNKVGVGLYLLFALLMSRNVFAQEDESKTFEGFDVDITKINKPQWGIQVTGDCSFMTYPSAGRMFDPFRDVNWATLDDNGLDDDAGITNPLLWDKLTPGNKMGTSEYFAKKLGYKPMFYQRTDLWLGVALPYRTNIYAMISFRLLNQDSGVQDDFSYTFLNLELEHYFNNHLKFRMGRLINKLSVSNFYGRIALGYKDAHVFGRTPFVNDALEFDINYRDKGLPVFIIGAKPLYKKFELGTLYAAAHYHFGSHFQTYLLASVNKTKGSTIKTYWPAYKDKNEQGDRWYSAYEYELAYKAPTWSAFANMGAYANYIGPVTHFSGPRDITKGNEPWIIKKGDSFSNTLTASMGVTIRPSALIEKFHFFKSMGVECEGSGFAGNKFKSLNGYFFAKFMIAKNFYIDYSCNPQWIKFNSDKFLMAGDKVAVHTDRLHVCAHYLRVSVVFGKPARVM